MRTGRIGLALLFAALSAWLRAWANREVTLHRLLDCARRRAASARWRVRFIGRTRHVLRGRQLPKNDPVHDLLTCAGVLCWCSGYRQDTLLEACRTGPDRCRPRLIPGSVDVVNYS